MSLRHAVCDKDGRVVNVVLWDGVSPWHPHDPTHYVVQHDEADITDQHYVDINGHGEAHWFKKHEHMPAPEKQDPEDAKRPPVITGSRSLVKEERSIKRTDGSDAVLHIYR
jgi:hypothetical protein